MLELLKQSPDVIAVLVGKVRDALERSRDQTEAAAMLGISARTLSNIIRSHPELRPARKEKS